jgi:peptidoglycan LD-endopeptidase CwlK
MNVTHIAACTQYLLTKASLTIAAFITPVVLMLPLSAAIASTDKASPTSLRDQHFNCLAKAYPDSIKISTDRASLVSAQGIPYPYDPTIAYNSFREELDRGDLYSQLRQSYPLGDLSKPPEPDHDPGRLRYTPLFKDMYGKSQAEVAANLVPVYWAPCNCSVQFNKVNGASIALDQVGREIVEAGLAPYVNQSLGTFNWRVIAGTQRLSMHSFGISIDFQLPKSLGRYWRWDKNHDKNGYPAMLLQDPGLNKVIAIFEKHGFIWGGKWWHYDSIHFEYRPEMTIPECSGT